MTYMRAGTMTRTALHFAAGFFRQGAPESMPRLCALLFCVTACICALIGAVQHHDTSTIVLALGAPGAASLFSRKTGTVPSGGAADAPSLPPASQESS